MERLLLRITGLEAMLQITKSGYFDIFANSYIIEIANNSCEIDFVGFNNFRKKDYQLVTSINNNNLQLHQLSHFSITSR